MKGLSSLRWLLMPENLLCSFPLKELEGLEALQWINLSDNQLTLDNEEFPELGNITEM